MNWLQKICKVLRHPKSKQIKSSLISLVFTDTSHKKIKKILGKCVLGELGCRAGMKPMELHRLDCDTDHYDKIMRRYDVPKWLLDKNLPELELLNDDDFSIRNKYIFNETDHVSLSTWLFHLNDDFALTEPEIADFLETTFKDAV